MNIRTPAATAAILIAACLLTAGPAQAQTWEYKSYKRGGMGGSYDKDRFNLGTISVEEKDGKHFFRMVAGPVDVCYRGALPVTVTRTDETTTIEVIQAISGCEEFRYIIRNDGSGGIKQIKRGERWAENKFDHGLTPVKP
jgi:hypothetical protein